MLDPGGSFGIGMSMMAGLRLAAAEGRFAVNETGGKALLVAIREMAKWVDDNLIESDIFAQQLPLGSSNGANVMKPYMQQVAIDKEGFITQLREFRTSLEDAEAAILDAMGNYDTMEQGIGGNFREV